MKFLKMPKLLALILSPFRLDYIKLFLHYLKIKLTNEYLLSPLKQYIFQGRRYLNFN